MSHATRTLRHGRIELALHELRPGEGMPLLLLHELSGSSADWEAAPLEWSGPVHALDLSGHGRSGHSKGGLYYPELFAADADVALEALEHAVRVGAGVGAYAALLLAGARTEQVPGAVLLEGRGLAGGGAEPGPERVGRRIPEIPPGGRRDRGVWDPHAEGCEQDIRPTDYARDFAESARRLVFVANDATPPWWNAAREAPASEAAADLGAALARLAS